MAKRRTTAIRARAPNSLAPVRILKQIAILQITYYLSATLLILFTMLVAGHSFSAGLVLGSSTAVRGDTALGLTMGLLWLLSGLVVVIAMTIILARSKLVLDFALTLHFLHLLITSIYQGGIPREITWWGLQGLSAVWMVVLGGWACRWRELRPISIAVPGRSTDGTSGDADLERGEDYEMVAMIGKESGAESVGDSGGGVGRSGSGSAGG